jgi:hypothetical protein
VRCWALGIGRYCEGVGCPQKEDAVDKTNEAAHDDDCLLVAAVSAGFYYE